MQQMERIQGQLSRMNISEVSRNDQSQTAVPNTMLGTDQPQTAVMNALLESSYSNYDADDEEKEEVFHDASEEEEINYYTEFTDPLDLLAEAEVLNNMGW